MSQTERKLLVKKIRDTIGDNYWFDERRGAKTNEYGMTKGQVIRLAEELADLLAPNKKVEL